MPVASPTTISCGMFALVAALKPVQPSVIDLPIDLSSPTYACFACWSLDTLSLVQPAARIHRIKGSFCMWTQWAMAPHRSQESAGLHVADRVRETHEQLTESPGRLGVQHVSRAGDDLEARI